MAIEMGLRLRCTDSTNQRVHWWQRRLLLFDHLRINDKFIEFSIVEAVILADPVGGVVQGKMELGMVYR